MTLTITIGILFVFLGLLVRIAPISPVGSVFAKHICELSFLQKSKLREKSEILRSASLRGASTRIKKPLPAAQERVPAKVALLMPCIAPYFLPVLRCLANAVETLRVLVSTPMEKDRFWKPDWNGIDVTVQKSIESSHRQDYKSGYAMTFFRHYPYDSLSQIARYKPDVVISAQLGFRTLLTAIYRVFNRNSRLILWVDASEHTEREVGACQTAIRKAFLRTCDAVVVNGESGSRYVQRLGIPSERVFAAPYVSNVPALAEQPLMRTPTEARRLLYVGQLIERKGLEPCLRELARWADVHKDTDYEMWLVGDGPLRETLLQTPRPPNVKLSFFGNIPYSDLASYYSHAGLFIFPSLCDTWAVVVNEALTAGLPVLGSAYSQAVEELVQDGMNGWTFRPDYPEELQHSLDSALSAPLSILARMRENARASVCNLTAEYAAAGFLRAIEFVRGK